MTQLLRATCKGMVRLGPGQKPQRIREDEEVLWTWPVLKDGEEPEGDNRRPPPRWEVIRTMGAAETAERLAGKPTPNTDYARNRATNDHFEPEVVRGFSDADQELIRAAVAGLERDNQEQWTVAGKPQVEAVRLEVERMHEEETGKRQYPNWVKRDVIDNASDITRNSG